MNPALISAFIKLAAKLNPQELAKWNAYQAQAGPIPGADTIRDMRPRQAALKKMLDTQPYIGGKYEYYDEALPKNLRGGAGTHETIPDKVVRSGKVRGMQRDRAITQRLREMGNVHSMTPAQKVSMGQISYLGGKPVTRSGAQVTRNTAATKPVSRPVVQAAAPTVAAAPRVGATANTMLRPRVRTQVPARRPQPGFTRNTVAQRPIRAVTPKIKVRPRVGRVGKLLSAASAIGRRVA